MILLAGRCPLCRFLRLGSCVQSSSFSFSCLSVAPAAPQQTYFFQLWFAASMSGLQFQTLLLRHHLCAVCARPFCFFREPVVTCGCPYFFSILFRSLSLRCFERFCLQFLYLKYSFLYAVFIFFCLSACGVTAAFACISSLPFPCLVCNLRLC